jgi:acyl-CoA thioesterase-1
MSQTESGVARPTAGAAGPVVILGASYARGWELSPIAGRPVINKGVSGQQSWELLERFDKDVVATKPSAVILWGFINDIFRTRRDAVQAAKGRARETFEKMIALSRSHGIEPILATEVTVRPQDTWSEMLASWVGWAMGKESYQDWVNLHVLEVNQWIRELAAREKLLLLDLQPVVSEPKGQRRKEFAREDGSHLPAAGYAALTDYATPLLQRHFTR